MKKHDVKEQGTAGNVSSRKRMKERKVKLKEITNIARNT